MKKFLEYIAEDIINKYGTKLSRIAIVFPNKRASLFLNELLAKKANQPMWSPAYITISDLFRKHSSLTVGDPIKLVCDLHKSYTECTGIDETLDHFFGWGQLLIADFDDIDKNMADASMVFKNIENLHELDDISYLDEEQKSILRRFFSNFTDNSDSELKKRFLQLWCNIGNIYENFRTRLRNQNMAYEGMMYRDVATNPKLDFKFDEYLFVGFNVVQKVEQELFSQIKRTGKAHFYWDFDEYYMPKKGSMQTNNEAGRYISQYLKDFPNELDTTDPCIYGCLKQDKDITYVSASTENVQARFISDWLKRNQRYKHGKDVAIVLCDESLLSTVIHCIPQEAEKINITTGYPLLNTMVSLFVTQLLELRINGYSPSSGKYRAKYVARILSHPYSNYITDKCQQLIRKLKDERIYQPTPETLAIDGDTRTLFKEQAQDESLLDWVMEILRIVADRCGAKDNDPLFQESLFRMYTLCNRLNELIKSGDLDIDTITLQKLMAQLVNSTSVPFHGEPAEGIQIMGILETRNLDFDHVLILSCNEGNMPKGINDSSFIPYSVRKAHGLTTIDNKVAIYAYYFYNLIQRASDVTIAYNNSTENGHTGEMSRFMLQLMVESDFKIKRVSLQTGQQITFHNATEIHKNGKIMERLDAMDYISPTSINRYMRCPLQFFYNNIALIKEPDEDELDEVSNRIFGNVFHTASENLYKELGRKGGTITAENIKYALKHRELIERIVDGAFSEVVFNNKTNKKLEYNGLQLINREVLIRYICRLLEIDESLTPFKINDVESSVYMDMDINTSAGKRSINIGGRIDRLDQVIDKTANSERIRVIDYKTGRYPKKKTNTIEEIFEMPTDQGKHCDYFLQTMLYALIIRNDKKYNKGNLPVSPGLLFIQHTAEEDYDPTIIIGKDKLTDIATVEKEFSEHLAAILSEIFEPTKPFYPTSDKSACLYCPYKGICGV